MSANIHSPVSVTVIDVRDIAIADASAIPSVIIENDYKYDELLLQKKMTKASNQL